MVNNANYSIEITIDEVMEKAIKNIKFDVDNRLYEKMDWSLFVSTALLVFSKMMENDIKPREFDDFLNTHNYKKKGEMA